MRGCTRLAAGGARGQRVCAELRRELDGVMGRLGRRSRGGARAASTPEGRRPELRRERSRWGERDRREEEKKKKRERERDWGGAAVRWEKKRANKP